MGDADQFVKTVNILKKEGQPQKIGFSKKLRKQLGVLQECQ